MYHRSSLRRLLSTTCLSAVAVLVTLGIAPPGRANPQDGVVSAGSATITASGNKLDIHQTTDRAVIDWRSFDVGMGEHTQFYQPNSGSIAVNRIGSGSPSVIAGQLSANGKVVIVNPNGVMFTGTSVVDVGGLVATSSNISNENVMAGGKLELTPSANPNAVVVNNGSITVADAGLVGFVAPHVVNNGVITAKLGKVHLASGDSATVDFYGDGLINLAVSDGVQSQLVSNTGVISASGGTIALTAAAGREVVNSVINVEGILEARSIGEQNGEIIISAEGSNAVADNITTDKGKKSGSSTVLVHDAILDVSGRNRGERGGKITIAADNVALLNRTIIDASGHTGLSNTTAGGKISDARIGAAGGDIQIGGDYLGSGITPTAMNLYVDKGVFVFNDALETGDAGRTIFWSDGTAQFYGNVYARALGGLPVDPITGHAMQTHVISRREDESTHSTAPLPTAEATRLSADALSRSGEGFAAPNATPLLANPGMGGFVETSGHRHLNAGGYVDLTAASGERGTYFLDPTNIMIYGNVDPAFVSTDASINIDSTLKIWLDGQDINGDGIANNPANGTSIVSWIDKSGNANNATLAGTTYNSTIQSIQVATTGGVLFNGSTITTGNIFSLQEKVAGADVNGRVLQGTTGNYLVGNWGTNGNALYIEGNPNAYSSGTANPSQNLGVKLYGLEYTSANAVNFYAEGSLLSATTGANSIAGITWGTNSYGGAGEATDHQFREFIVYNAPLSTNDRNLVEQYQSAKWGIALTPPGTGATEVAKATAADGYSVFTTRYLERLSQSANVSLQATNNITLDLKGDTLNFTTANRSLTLTAGNQITTASTGTITTNNGAISLTGANGILFNHAFTLNSGTAETTLTTTNSPITLSGATNFGGATTLNAGTSTITTTSTGTITSGVSRTLAFAADNMNIGAAVNAGGNTIINTGTNTRDIYLGTSATGLGLDLDTAELDFLDSGVNGSFIFASSTSNTQDVTLGGFSFNNHMGFYQGGTLTIAAATNLLGKNFHIATSSSVSDVNINAALTSAGGDFTLRSTNNNLGLATAGTGTVNLSTTDLDNLTDGWGSINFGHNGNNIAVGTYSNWRDPVNFNNGAIGTATISGAQTTTVGSNASFNFNGLTVFNGNVDTRNSSASVGAGTIALGNFAHTLAADLLTTDADITTNGAITVASGTRRLSASANGSVAGYLRVNNTIGGAGTASLDAYDMDINADITTAWVRLRPSFNSGTMGLAGAAGTMQLSSADLGHLKAASVSIGDAMTLGAWNGTMNIGAYDWNNSLSGMLLFRADTGINILGTQNFNSAAGHQVRYFTNNYNIAAALNTYVSRSLTFTESSVDMTVGSAATTSGIDSTELDRISDGWSSISFGGETPNTILSSYSNWRDPITVQANNQLTISGAQTTAAGSNAAFTINQGYSTGFGALINADIDMRPATGGTGAITLSGATHYGLGTAHQLGANLNSGSGGISIDKPLALTGSANSTRTLNASTGTLNISDNLSTRRGSIAATDKNLNIVADNATLIGGISGTTGSLSIAPNSAARSVGLGSASGGLSLTSTELDLITGFSGGITFGSATSGDLASSLYNFGGVPITLWSGQDINLIGTLSSAAMGNAITLIAGRDVNAANAGLNTSAGNGAVNITAARHAYLGPINTGTGNFTLNAVDVFLFAADIASGLVGYWNFDEGSGTVAVDSSGNGNTGTLTNGPTWSANTPFGTGTSLSFDGVNDRVDAGGSGILTGSWSVSAWVRTPSSLPGSNRAIAGRSGPAPSYPQNYLLYFSSADSRFRIGSNADGYLTAISTTIVAPNNWYLVTGTFESTTRTFNIFVNGLNNGSATISALPTTSGPQLIQMGASDGSVPGNFWAGLIDDVRIYNTALSTGAVSKLYTGTNWNVGTTNINATGNVTLDLKGDTLAAASGRDVGITAGGNITSASAGSITTTGGGADITFASGGATNIDNLALTSTGGAVSVTSTGLATLGDISAGTIFGRSLGAGSDITLGAGALLTASSTGDAITLVAGRNFINNSGSATPLSTVNGRALVYSTNPASDTLGGMDSDFRLFNCFYGSCARASSGAGNGFLYRYQPLLTITPMVQNLTYGDAVPSLVGYAYGMTGYLGSDSGADTLGGALNGSTSYTAGSNIGTYNINHASGTLTSAIGYGFTYANNPSGISVGQRALTVSTNNAHKTLADANPIFAGSNNLLPADSALISWAYAPIGYSGAQGSYTIAANATDPSNRLANYTRTNSYGLFTVGSTTINQISSQVVNNFTYMPYSQIIKTLRLPATNSFGTSVDSGTFDGANTTATEQPITIFTTTNYNAPGGEPVHNPFIIIAPKLQEWLDGKSDI
ncbi:MAG: LamG-like jellyroll fold domain-containing protein [Rickettsiales bacterium]